MMSLHKRFQSSDDQYQQDAFTLTEMMFSVAVAGIIMVAVVTTYVFCLKGFRSLSNYTEIHTDARRALDWFARDARIGVGINSGVSTQIILIVPTSINDFGNVTGTKLIKHSLIGNQWRRIDISKGNDTLLAENLDKLNFILYDRTGNVTTQVNQAVSVQVDASMKKQVLNRLQSQDLVSGRLRMRNVQ